MAVEQRLPGASPDATASLDAVLAAPIADTTSDATHSEATASAPALIPSPHIGQAESSRDEGQVDQDSYSCSMPPPSRSETFETRSSRSTSTTSRNTNRLSLTLPIAPPNSLPSRPTPTPTSSSVPPTPIETSTLNTPNDSTDFVIAIAAQERRVLELREELGRAEGELRKLQRQYTAAESYRKRPVNRNVDPSRSMATPSDGPKASDDTPAARRTRDLDRRKAILRAQSQGISRERQRTIIRGGHTRTLSLLSPTKVSSEVSVHEDPDVLQSPASSCTSRSPLLGSAPLNKRATWAPRQSQPSNGVQQIANDFKAGLWTFVEDLRQATVGDEAISGTTNRTSEMVARLSRMDSEQDTIRASSANRGRIPFPTELESAIDNSPSQASTGSFNDRFQHRRSTSKLESKTRKHFSWTPLTFDNFDDDCWSNWESPNVKTSRWSGSTVNGDIIPAIPERADENEGTLRRKRSRSELRSPSPDTPSKLEELPQAILNSLTPSNIKNTTSNFIKEWEKSLSPPPETTSFEASYHSVESNVL